MNQVRIGTLLSYLQTGLNAIITLCYTPVMISLLGKSEYGLYNTVASVISMIALLNFGFSSTYVKYYSTYRVKGGVTEIHRLNGMFVIIFGALSVVAAASGVFLSKNLQFVFSSGLNICEYVTAEKLMILLTLNLSISLISNIFTCIITAHEKFVFLKLVGLVRLVANPLLSIPVLLAGYGSVGMVLITVSLSAICDLLYAYFVVCKLKEKFVFRGINFKSCKEIFGFTMLIAVHLVVDQVNWNVDKILLGRFCGTDEVAVYSVGYSLYSHYMTVGLTMVGLFTPQVHKIVAQYNGSRSCLTSHLTRLFTRLGKMQYLLLLPVATGFIFVGQDFIRLWVGEEYYQAYYVALLLIIPGSIDIIQNIGIEIQRAQNLHAFRAKAYAVMAIINIVVSVQLCQRYGAVGCAIGTAISLTIVQGLIINVFYHKKCHINICEFWRTILLTSRGIMFPAMCALIVCRIKETFDLSDLILFLSGYLFTYCLSVYLWGLNQNEKKLIKEKLRIAG